MYVLVSTVTFYFYNPQQNVYDIIRDYNYLYFVCSNSLLTAVYETMKHAFSLMAIHNRLKKNLIQYLIIINLKNIILYYYTMSQK